MSTISFMPIAGVRDFVFYHEAKNKVVCHGILIQGRYLALLQSLGFARGEVVDEVARSHNQGSNRDIEAGHEAFCRQRVSCHLYVGRGPRIEHQMRQQ
jgi:hypothetical protein